MHPLNDDHIEKAFYKVKYHLGFIEENDETGINRLRESTVLDDVVYPIGDNSTDKGYYRAIKGLMDSDVAEIRAGCNEEVTEEGQHKIECLIINSYVNSLYGEFGDIDNDDIAFQLFELMLGHKIGTAKLLQGTLLCYANTSMGSFVENAFNGLLEKVETDFGMMHNILQGEGGTNHKQFVIKSGVLHSAVTVLAPHGNLVVEQLYSDLDTCCELMPNFYHAHMQRFYAKQGNVHPSVEMEQLKQLCERFPNGIELRNSYIVQLGVQHGEMDKAKCELKELRDTNPKRIDETWWVEAMLNNGQPQSVEHLKGPLIICHLMDCIISNLENILNRSHMNMVRPWTFITKVSAATCSERNMTNCLR